MSITTDGVFNFIPDTDYTGLDSFEFVVSDGNGGMASAVVNLVVNPVNDAADVMNASGEVTEDTVFNGQLLAVDKDGDAITFESDDTRTPQHGTLVVSAEGSFSYVPDINFVGVDTFGSVSYTHLTLPTILLV